ncbi:hypothetical protein ACT3TZ_14020, partial [Brachybacterium sp. AOP25-B2-12]|uniref:hypothetical protein n=1 Tax=Brachybacterium sp. AOP25-B2-12 TaxID=3457710 RepID=UPI004034718C
LNPGSVGACGGPVTDELDPTIEHDCCAVRYVRDVRASLIHGSAAASVRPVRCARAGEGQFG